MRRLVILFVAALLVLPLTAVPAAAVTDGQPDGAAHPFVGLIFDDKGLCSGALVAPTVVLTAGHCTAAFEDSGSSVLVTFDPDPTADSTFYEGSPYTDPTYVDGGVPGMPGVAAHDVGVVILKEPVALDVYGGLPDGEATDALEAGGQRFTVVGYGVQSFTKSGKPSAYGTRATATLASLTNRIAVDEQFLALMAPTGQDGAACFGDSGGPVLLGEKTVVAVVAAGTDERCGGPSLAARVDTPEVRSFLGSFLGDVSISVGIRVATTSAGVRLRDGPSTDGEIVTELAAGQELVVTGPAEEGSGYLWWPVRDSSDPDLIGYVAAPFLEPLGAASGS